jgi:hypothetical protein
LTDGPEPGQVSREDAAATIGARAELGGELEPAVVDAFVQRVEEAIDQRVVQRLAERDRGRGIDRTTVAVALGSLVLSVPITAVAANPDGAGGAGGVAAWIAIVLINVAHAWRRG